MAEKSFSAKEIIFREGDMSDNAYIVKSGKVDVLKHASHGEVLLASVGPGEPLGEMGLFEPRSPRSATARASEGTVVDVISEQEFHQMLAQCPERIMPIFNMLVNRLRATNVRVSEAEQATVILESDISKITIGPGSDPMSRMLKPFQIGVARLPFQIGGYPTKEETKMFKQNHLNIPCDGPPLQVSRIHCQIAIQDKGIYLVDNASRFLTYVNGKAIGRGRGTMRAPLQMGENKIVLGGLETPYALKVVCE